MQWKYIIDISENWQKCKQYEIDVATLAAKVATVFEEEILRENYEPALEDLVDELYWFAGEDKQDRAEFDDIMDDIYTWASGNDCWIKTWE